MTSETFWMVETRDTASLAEWWPVRILANKQAALDQFNHAYPVNAHNG